jgi:hypothetical protein
VSANPAVLLVDADAMIQVCFAGHVQPLRCLRDRYDVQPIVVEEVDAEVRSFQRKLGGNIPHLFDKAVTKGLLVVLTREELRARKPSLGPKFTETSVANLWADIEALGSEYNLRVDLGEAYTFAAAVILGVAAVSNDASAIRALRENSLQEPKPILRVFDLYTFALQAGAMTIRDVEDARSRLLGAGEHIPAAFRNQSVTDGLKAFAPRLVDASRNGDDVATTRDLAALRLEPSVAPGPPPSA